MSKLGVFEKDVHNINVRKKGLIKMTCNCRTILTTAVAVSGNNLVLTVPAMTFENCRDYIIRIAQDIPLTATNLMSVAIQIGAAPTLYAVVRQCGHNLYANQLRTRRNYRLKVVADVQRFVLTCGELKCGNCGTIATIPAAVEETAAVASVSVSAAKKAGEK